MLCVRRREFITFLGGAAAAWPLGARAQQSTIAAKFLTVDDPRNVGSALQEIVARNLAPMVPADGAGGVAVALRMNGRTFFFNYGWAHRAGERPITTDSLFNLASLRKVFEVTLLALAAQQGELSVDDPVARHVIELQQGKDIRRVTLAQLATHTSGLLLPHDRPPWPEKHYNFPEFIRALNAWKTSPGEQPGNQHRYAHAGFVLLQLALARRFGAPIEELIDQKVLRPLGMTSTILPPHDKEGRSVLAPAFKHRVVQGYSKDGERIGVPGNQQTHYDFPGGGQMFSSARDLAVLLAANLGELPIGRKLQSAMQLTQQGVLRIGPKSAQALAWEVNEIEDLLIVDKPGGLNNSSTYLGLVPSRNLGIVILSNRGSQYPYEVARQVLLPELARYQSPATAKRSRRA
jgi:beta-lactamase class C